MDIQYILKTITSFASDLQKHTSGAIKKTIHQDMSLLGYKLLLGIVIVSIVVFSIIQFGYAYLTLLSMYKDELTMKLVSFGILSILGVVALYFLFKNKKSEISFEPIVTNQFDLPTLITSFASGIMEGYQTKKHANQFNNQHAEELNSVNREI